MQELSKIGLTAVVSLLALLMSGEICEQCHQTVGDVATQPGLCRWMDAKFITANPDGTVTIARNAPVSQWPKAVRLYNKGDQNGGGQLEVTFYPSTPDPVRYTQAVLR